MWNAGGKEMVMSGTNETRALRDLVEAQLDQRWSQWVQAHPKLADAIDRVRLSEVAVRQLRDDPIYREAVEAAAVDEAQLAAAAKVLTRVQAIVESVLS